MTPRPVAEAVALRSTPSLRFPLRGGGCGYRESERARGTAFCGARAALRNAKVSGAQTECNSLVERSR